MRIATYNERMECAKELVSVQVRNDMIFGLRRLPEGWQNKFKIMYGNLEMSISDVVDNMPDDQLDHACFQINNSMKKLGI